MNEDWNPLPEHGATLEHPATAITPDKSWEKQDTLNSASGFATQSRDQLMPLINEHELTTQARQKHLQALRARPGFALIAQSTLLLKACQMDMDYPPKLRDYVRQQLKKMLLQTTGKPLSPDKLSIRLRTDTNPEIDESGRERYSRRMSLTDIGVLSFNRPMILELMQHGFFDKPLDDASSSATSTLTASTALELISKASWEADYRDLMEKFWSRHRGTYRALAKLSFLDELAHQFARKVITREGYQLALDALGLKAFPTSAHVLEISIRGTYSTANMLSINGQVIPDAFQLRSNNTSHCFIHMPGRRTAPLEYISEEPRHMTQKIIEVLNSVNALATTADDSISAQLSVGLKHIEDDVFTAITQAQEIRSLDYLATQVGSGEQPDPLKAIGRAMSLLSAVDIWQTQPQILSQIPAPDRHAADIMGTVLREKYGQHLNPDHVFIRYLRGHSITPLGNARNPGNDIQVPSENPVSLSDALVNNYRVASPTGYIDHGGRSVVYLDPTGKGEWSASQELPIDPQAIEKKIQQIDFLKLMNGHIDTFWEQHKSAVEDSLQNHFMTQAVLCLKLGSLQRTGFDLIVKALDEQHNRPEGTPVQWSVPGFFLQHSVFENPSPQNCSSLLVLSEPGKASRVFYQAGMIKAFVECPSEALLQHYLKHAALSQTWRQSVLNYVPLRHHERLTYILKVWSGEQTPGEPVSSLRPWTDVLINHDVHKAMARDLDKHNVTNSPFACIRQGLQQNSRWDAEDIIVTSHEVSLRYWSRRFNHLQLLLAPMSLLMTPALIASLATEVGIAALSIASANLPGARYADKQQAFLTILSLALLQMPPVTPRMAHALRKWAAPVRPALRSVTSATHTTKNFGTWLNRSMGPRQTRLEKFFHTDAMLKTWHIPANPWFSTLAVKAWKLRRQFLIWTAETGQARTLVISSHGYHLPWSKQAAIPNGTELHVYTPHGHSLSDPGLHRVVSRKVEAFAVLDTQNNSAVKPAPPGYTLTDKLMAGTSRQGMIKNYTLGKFQSPNYESYRDISHIVRNSNGSPFLSALPPAPMDILTVRNRFGMPNPSLENLFEALADSGIHYDRIVLLHCRCSLLKALVGQAPVYRAP